MFLCDSNQASNCFCTMEEATLPQKRRRVGKSTIGPTRHSWDTDYAEKSYEGLSDAQRVAACEKAIDILSKEHVENNLSAYTLCILAHFLSLAGVQGRIQEFAMEPGLQMGKYQRRVDEVLGLRKSSARDYKLFTPGYNKKAGLRENLAIRTKCPVELLSDEINNSSETFDILDQGNFKLGEQTEHFQTHPLVINRTPEERKRIVPYAVYLDGVPFSLTRVGYDTVVGFWIINLVTQTRHLVTAIRKSDMCKCGCKGWCTMAVVFFFLRFQFECLAAGVYPTSRHDKTDWLPNDCWRELLAGAALGFTAVCLFIKGDWVELSTTLGMPTWKDEVAPCLCCHCPKTSELYNFRSFLADSLSWGESLPNDYEDACRKCEITITLNSVEEWRGFRNKLIYDKTRQGVRGLVLKQAIPEMGVNKDDRVEPSWDLMDTGEVLTCPKDTKYPITITLWRRSDETRSRHRNPLFDAPGRNQIGISTSSLALDVLHTIHLGIAQFCILEILWRAFDADVFETNIISKEDRLGAHCQMLEAQLFKWYKQRSTKYPEEKLTHLKTLKQTMLGTGPSSTLKTKAAESFGLLLFCLDFVDMHKLKIPKADLLYPCVQELLSVLAIMKREPDFLSAEAYQDLTNQSATPIVVATLPCLRIRV